MKLSACMIVKNEERCLERCIRSFKDVVSEIVVVDTGSTDRTIEIARSLGAKVYHYKWHNDFAAAKNYAISKTNGDWLIMLDADEYFQDDMAENVKKHLIKIDSIPEYSALCTCMYNYNKDDPEKKGDFFYTIRVFRKREDIYYVGSIHERLNQNHNDAAVPFIVAPEDILLLHDGYSYTVEIHKKDRNFDILQSTWQDGEHKPDIAYYLAQCYISRQEYEKASEYLRDYVLNAESISIAVGIHPYVLYVHLLAKAKRFLAEAYPYIEKAISKFPNHPSAHLNHGKYFGLQLRLEKSLQALLKTLECRAAYNEKDNMEMSRNMLDDSYWSVFRSIGQIYVKKNMPHEAVEYCLNALRLPEGKYDRYALGTVIETLDEQLLLRNLMQIYDFTSEKDLTFLVSSLRNLRPGNVFLVVFEKWFVLTQKQDINAITMYVLIGEFALAADMLVKRYAACVQHERLDEGRYFLTQAVMAAILSGQAALCEKVSANDPMAAALIESYCNRSSLSSDNAADLALLLEYVLGLRDVDDPVILRLLAMATDADSRLRVGLILTKHRAFAQALPFLQEAYDGKEDKNMTPSLRLLETQFSLGDMQTAETLFRQIDELELNVHPGLFSSYGYWIAERLPEGTKRDELVAVADKWDAKAAEIGKDGDDIDISNQKKDVGEEDFELEL